MHRGLDTRFYLDKGFSVVALEANPAMCAAARAAFSSEIDGGRLHVVERALWHAGGGAVPFFLNHEKDDWSSTSRAWAEKGGHRAEEIAVPTTTLAELLDRHGTPRYAKCDVEGMDKAFLAAARSLLRELVDPRRYREAMASIPVPVLMLQGDRDRLVPVAAAREAARRHPGWRYRELPGVGHVPQMQTPELVAEHVLEWLRDTAEVRSPASDAAQDSVARSASSPV